MISEATNELYRAVSRRRTSTICFMLGMSAGIAGFLMLQLFVQGERLAAHMDLEAALTRHGATVALISCPASRMALFRHVRSHAIREFSI